MDTPPKADLTSDWLQALARARWNAGTVHLKALTLCSQELEGCLLTLAPALSPSRSPRQHVSGTARALPGCEGSMGLGKSVRRNPAGYLSPNTPPPPDARLLLWDPSPAHSLGSGTFSLADF